MGLGKSLRKAWKKTFGKLEDVTKDALPIIAPIVGTMIAPGVGTLAGAAIGQGIGQYRAGQQQEKALKAQIASAEKIAQMQNNAVVSAAPVPTQNAQTAAISEENEATRKARAFRFSNSVRNSTLGGGFGNKKKTVG